MRNAIDRPIFLVGTHRSGTTWLGSLLGRAPEVAYWIEPRQVWSYGNYAKPDDLLTENDVTPQISAHIRSRFYRFANRAGKRRFCEKTPNNCWRIKFMHKIFPTGKFVFIVRDGRAVFRSTEEIKQTSANWNRVWSRLKESSMKEFPAYLDRIPWMLNKLTGGKMRNWGVRPPGWKEWIETYSDEQISALQWTHTISYAAKAFEELPSENRIKIRYEDLVTSPTEHGRTIAKFCELDDIDSFETLVRQSALPSSNFKWRDELSEDLLDSIRPFMEPVLDELGYDW